MTRTERVSAGLSLCAALVVMLAPVPARAQTPVQTVRVASGPAHVLMWRDVHEHRIATVATGTMLDVILIEDDWYWIILPPDAYGTRRSGWIRGILVEPIVVVVDPAQRPPLQGPPRDEMPAAAPPAGVATLGGFVQGLGGATFGDETSSTVGGVVAFTVAPHVQVTAEVGRMQNVMPSAFEASLVEAAQRTSSLFFFNSGQLLPATLRASAPALYGLFGVRGWIPTASTVQPYLDGGFGFANVMPDVEIRLSGRDVTRDAIDFGILAEPEDEIEPMIGIGGGVLVPLVNGLAADIGYRYQRVFTGDGVNVNRVTLGLSYRF